MQRAHQRIARELSMLKGDLPDGYLSCFTQQSDNFSVIVAREFPEFHYFRLVFS
jgi:hypothetical protein